MNENEAAGYLRTASRVRRQKLWLGWAAVSLAASIVTGLLSVWWGSSWKEAVTFSGGWVVTGILLGWLMTTIDSALGAAQSVESTVSAVITNVDGQKITVCPVDGEELVLLIESPRRAALDTEQRLWLSSPASPGKYVVGVLEPGSGPDQKLTVLWPADVARSPGRWA